MKVLFLAAAESIHTIRWVNSLVEKGLDIVLVSLKDQRDTKNLINQKVEVIYLPFGGRLGYYLNIPFLKKIVSKEKPDILNVHYASGYGTLGRFINFDKKLLNVWGSDVYDFPNESKMKKRIIEKNLKSYSAIASTSHCMAEETKKYLENKNRKIYITPFGVDIKKFKNLNLKKEDNKIIVGIVKTLSKKYGIEYLIRAIKELENILAKEIFFKIRLVIYGKGELEEKLKQLSKKLKIENKVKFKGYIDNSKVPEAINRMDIFVVPSILESFGVAAVEAMACEIPIIVSDADGLKEVVVDNETGFVVPKKSSIDIAKKIKIIIENKEIVKKFKKNARERVLKLYDWDKNVNNMINIYKELLK